MSIIPSNPYAEQFWDRYGLHVLMLPAHVETTIPKFDAPSPVDAGYVFSWGDAGGQKANYRLPLDDGTDRELHAKEFDDHYTLHWDWKSAIRKPLEHIAADAPHWIGIGIAGAILAGIGVAVAFGKKNVKDDDEEDEY